MDSAFRKTEFLLGRPDFEPRSVMLCLKRPEGMAAAVKLFCTASQRNQVECVPMDVALVNCPGLLVDYFGREVADRKDAAEGTAPPPAQTLPADVAV